MYGPSSAPFIPLYKDGAGIPTKDHLEVLSNLFRERKIRVLERVTVRHPHHGLSPLAGH